MFNKAGIINMKNLRVLLQIASLLDPKYFVLVFKITICHFLVARKYFIDKPKANTTICGVLIVCSLLLLKFCLPIDK